MLLEFPPNEAHTRDNYLIPTGARRVVLLHKATGLYAAKGVSHWTAVDKPVELWLFPDAKGHDSRRLVHIRDVTNQLFMRHSNQDDGILAQTGTDEATSWNFQDVENGECKIVDSAGRYLCVDQQSSKLYTPSCEGKQPDATQRTWKIIDVFSESTNIS